MAGSLMVSFIPQYSLSGFSRIQQWTRQKIYSLHSRKEGARQLSSNKCSGKKADGGLKCDWWVRAAVLMVLSSKAFFGKITFHGRQEGRKQAWRDVGRWFQAENSRCKGSMVARASSLLGMEPRSDWRTLCSVEPVLGLMLCVVLKFLTVVD